MRMRHSLSSINIPGTRQARLADRACAKRPEAAVMAPALLVISTDIELREKLRQAASDQGRSVVAADGAEEALRVVRSARIAAVLLDLDLPSQGAWPIADGLLREEGCPPLILLTGRREEFDMSTAIRAGSLLDKSADVAKVLEQVDQATALPDSNREERNSVQRILIQWLRPCAWSVPVTPTYRFWGINE
jgi:DNA-binding NtrC family response regulator